MIKKRIDFTGRIVIPKNIRDRAHLSPNTYVLIDVDPTNRKIILQKEEIVLRYILLCKIYFIFLNCFSGDILKCFCKLKIISTLNFSGSSPLSILFNA